MKPEPYVTKRELLLEEVRMATEEWLDYACQHVMPPWLGQGPEVGRIMMRIVNALKATDDNFFESRRLLLKAMGKKP